MIAYVDTIFPVKKSIEGGFAQIPFLYGADFSRSLNDVVKQHLSFIKLHEAKIVHHMYESWVSELVPDVIRRKQPYDPRTFSSTSTSNPIVGLGYNGRIVVEVPSWAYETDE